MANKVLIDDVSVTMQLKNNGITFQIKGDDDKHRGYLKINRGYIQWFEGRTQKPSCKISIDEFIKPAREGQL